jgi:hypothetical protein
MSQDAASYSDQVSQDAAPSHLYERMSTQRYLSKGQVC